MEVIGIVVDGERVGVPVERELSFGDPVAIPADQRAEVRRRRLVEILLRRIEAQHDVRRPAVAIRDFQRPDDAAIRHHLHLHAAAVRQREHLDWLSVDAHRTR